VELATKAEPAMNQQEVIMTGSNLFGEYRLESESAAGGLIGLIAQE
jgi:hypothetical protein